jgi:hypothetical protein
LAFTSSNCAGDELNELLDKEWSSVEMVVDRVFIWLIEPTLMPFTSFNLQPITHATCAAFVFFRPIMDGGITQQSKISAETADSALLRNAISLSLGAWQYACLNSTAKDKI